MARIPLRFSVDSIGVSSRRIGFHGLPAVFVALALLALAGCGSTTPGPDNGTPGVTDITLDPPSAGWQYALEPFELMPGQELQQCFFFEVPTDVEAFVNRIQIAQTTGTHHMNIFRVRTIKGLDPANGWQVTDGECWKSLNWSDWPLVVNSQNEGNVEINLPEGVVHSFAPHEKLMLQTHYVNATTQKTPGVGKVLVNFHRVGEDAVKAKLGTAFATNQSIRICPGDSDRRFETTCRFAKGEPVTIYGANGHFHSRGRRFTMSVFDPAPEASAEPAPFYESRRWDDALFAKNLGVTVPAQGGITYACEFTVGPSDCGDANDGCCFTFGGKVEFQEHCNAFVYYYPARDDTDINCF